MLSLLKINFYAELCADLYWVASAAMFYSVLNGLCMKTEREEKRRKVLEHEWNVHGEKFRKIQCFIKSQMMLLDADDDA